MRNNLECLNCSARYAASEFEISKKHIPHCESCGKILKPSVIFFGENIPEFALNESRKYAEKADGRTGDRHFSNCLPGNRYTENCEKQGCLHNRV